MLHVEYNLATQASYNAKFNNRSIILVLFFLYSGFSNLEIHLAYVLYNLAHR